MHRSKQFLQFIKSLKFRLILLILVIAIVPSLILSAGILHSYAARAVSIRESEILSQAKILANQIATSEYMSMDDATESSTIQAQIDMLTRAGEDINEENKKKLSDSERVVFEFGCKMSKEHAKQWQQFLDDKYDDATRASESEKDFEL